MALTVITIRGLIARIYSKEPSKSPPAMIYRPQHKSKPKLSKEAFDRLIRQREPSPRANQLRVIQSDLTYLQQPSKSLSSERRYQRSVPRVKDRVTDKRETQNVSKRRSANPNETYQAGRNAQAGFDLRSKLDLRAEKLSGDGRDNSLWQVSNASMSLGYFGGAVSRNHPTYQQGGDGQSSQLNSVQNGNQVSETQSRKPTKQGNVGTSIGVTFSLKNGPSSYLPFIAHPLVPYLDSSAEEDARYPTESSKASKRLSVQNRMTESQAVSKLPNEATEQSGRRYRLASESSNDNSAIKPYFEASTKMERAFWIGETEEDILERKRKHVGRIVNVSNSLADSNVGFGGSEQVGVKEGGQQNAEQSGYAFDASKQQSEDFQEPCSFRQQHSKGSTHIATQKLPIICARRPTVTKEQLKGLRKATHKFRLSAQNEEAASMFRQRRATVSHGQPKQETVNNHNGSQGSFGSDSAKAVQFPQIETQFGLAAEQTDRSAETRPFVKQHASPPSLLLQRLKDRCELLMKIGQAKELLKRELLLDRSRTADNPASSVSELKGAPQRRYCSLDRSRGGFGLAVGFDRERRNKSSIVRTKQQLSDRPIWR